MSQSTPATICFLLRDDEILLAMKKRGFGVGNWNGAGGKIKNGESVLDTTIREVQEEIGVTVRPEDLEKVAEIGFHFPEKDGWDMFVHTFFARRWEGEPTESEEMKPRWFKISEIPYENMWKDDPFWIGRVIAGEKLKGDFYFKGSGEEVADYNLITVRNFN